MHFSKVALPLAGLAAVQAAGVSPSLKELESRDYYCPAGSEVNVLISTYLVAYPVVINQYFEDNTFIIINGGLTINIDNAPTTLSTTVTATSTVTSTVTEGVGAIATPFLISAAPATLRKRQSGGYLNAAGALTSDCSAAAVFTLKDGVLSSNGLEVSTNSGTPNMIFATSTVTGNIDKAISAPGNVLSWDNDAFTNNAAAFCFLTGFVRAVFDGTIPSGCAPLVLSAVPASLCTGSSSSTSDSSSVTGSSTATGTSSSSTSGPTGFNLALNIPSAKSKRASTYLTTSGGTTTDRSQAATFFIIDGQLLSEGQYYGVDGTSGTVAFTPSATPNMYSRTFSNNGGILDFFNPAFPFTISFCIQDGQINIVLSDKPATCITITLGVVPVGSSVTATGTATGTMTGSFTGTLTHSVESMTTSFTSSFHSFSSITFYPNSTTSRM